MQLLPLLDGDASSSSVNSFSLLFHSDGSKGFARIGGSSRGRCEIPPSYYRKKKKQLMLSNLTLYFKPLIALSCILSNCELSNPTQSGVLKRNLPALRRVCSVAST